MPLIILTGIPSSGKSTRAKQLQDFFIGKEKPVTVISENLAVPKAGFQKNEIYADSQKEKTVRADMKSETQRRLNSNEVVILDGGNYIKGYRYEIFCSSKSVRVNQCTVYCAIQQSKAWEFNELREIKEQNLSVIDETELNNSNVAYSSEIFHALCLRYEEPIANNRWDSPLYTILPEDELPFEEIFNALFVKAAPKPNLSTQNPPLSDTNYLYEMDRITQDVIAQITSARKINNFGPIKIAKCETAIDLPSHLNPIQLNRLRRSFINFSKSQSSTTSLDRIPNLFVQFLNSNFQNNQNQ